MNLYQTAVKRPVTTTMLVLIAVVFGILSIFNINLDMMPNMDIPIAIVSTTYSGAGPEEMENLITKPLEAAMGTVAGVSEISSSSSYGSSIVIVQFEDGTNINNAALDMRERVDMIKGYLPDGANSPNVMKIDINSMSSISIAITGTSGDLVELKHIVEEKVVDRIERQDGVASVSVSGGREKEISVVLNEERLRGYGISESTVAQILMAENATIPTGSVKQGDKTLTLRVSGEFASLEDIRNLPFNTSRGGIVYLRDFAEVFESLKDITSVSYINNEPSVMLSVQKQSTANTVNVSDKVIAEIERIKADNPGLNLRVVMDPADFVRISLASVVDSALQGGLLAVIILYVFLRNFRTTLIVAVSMPVSIVATFALMYYSDMTINIMSLGGLTLGVGMLVDNSIVVLESIYRKMEEGEDRVSASINGAKEVAMSVVASTLTTVAVFLPISFSGGLAAQIFNQLSMTIAFSLASSLAVALTFVPMAASLILKVEYITGERTKRNLFTNILDAFGRGIESIEAGYGKLLKYCVNHKALTCIVVTIFTILTAASLLFVGMEFMPATDEGAVSITVNMPKGQRLEETEKTAFQVVERIGDNYSEISSTSISIGGGGMMSFGGGSTDSATITLNLVEKQQRQKSANQLASEIAAAVSDIPGAEITVEAISQSMGNFGAGSGIDINIKGDDLDELSRISGELVDILASIEGVRDAKTSIQDTTPQATIKVNRQKASSYGISAASVSSIIRTAVTGTVSTTFKEDGDELDIRVRQTKENFDYITDIQNILIPSPLGINVPLYELATVTMEDMPTSISRDNQQRYVSISAKLDGRDTGSVMTEFYAKTVDYALPQNYFVEESGALQQMNETFESLGFALIMAVVLVYMIMAAEFESLVYPFIVMFSIPIAASGGLFGLFLMGEPISITGFLGIIMLAGIVVNNAIVLIDYINLLIKERNYNIVDAILVAGPVRLRPILMTTLTTVLALIPMMFSQAAGAELMRGLATVVVFGLTLSTLVTLIFIPVIYLLVDSFGKRFKKTKEEPVAN